MFVNANTARLAVPTGLNDSDAILLPQMDTRQRIARSTGR